MKRILIDGGYIENGTYYYYLTDHLGNNRVVASGTGTVLQKNEYYPFGMPMPTTGNAEQEVQPYKFGGKELERENGLRLYDFEARQMDAGIGRFTSMNPQGTKAMMHYSQMWINGKLYNAEVLYHKTKNTIMHLSILAMQ